MRLRTIADIDQHVTTPTDVIETIADFNDVGLTVKEITDYLVRDLEADGTTVERAAAEAYVRRELTRLHGLVRVEPAVVTREGMVLLSIESKPNPILPGKVMQRWIVTEDGNREIQGLQLRALSRPEHFVVVHPSTKPFARAEGRWQATWFDDQGAGGDITSSTLEGALKEQAPPFEYVVEEVHLKNGRHLVLERGDPRANPEGQPSTAEAKLKRIVAKLGRLGQPFRFREFVAHAPDEDFGWLRRQRLIANHPRTGADRWFVTIAGWDWIGDVEEAPPRRMLEERVRRNPIYTEHSMVNSPRRPAPRGNPAGPDRPVGYEGYHAALEAAYRWADGHPATRTLHRYAARDVLYGVAEGQLRLGPVGAGDGEGLVDRDFWLGEIMGAILADATADPAMSRADVHRLDDEVERLIDRNIHHRSRRGNPASGARASRAAAMFSRFHTRDWRGEGDFHADFKIPDELACLGELVNTDYQSDKLNPGDGKDEGWIDYTHKHDAGVRIYAPVAARRPGDGNVVRTPAAVARVGELAWLGKYLGGTYRTRGGRQQIAGTEPLPELYASPSGKALFVVQGKRTLLFVIWGGRLAVERRGIVH